MEPPAEIRLRGPPQALPRVFASWGATRKRLGVQVLEGMVCAELGCPWGQDEVDK